MKETYRAWVEAQKLPPCPAGLCHEVSSRMVAAFPELRLARGHFEPFGETKKYPHWWCVAADGQIVDPTASQFDALGYGEYREHVGAEPFGRCLQCGLYVWDSRSFCDETCAADWNRDITAMSFNYTTSSSDEGAHP